MDELLNMLKVDLGIMTDAYNGRLVQYLESAKRFIEEQGATLNLSVVSDCQLVVDYASWMWRRRDTHEGMPRMIRYALNNRIFSEKIREGE